MLHWKEKNIPDLKEKNSKCYQSFAKILVW